MKPLNRKPLRFDRLAKEVGGVVAAMFLLGLFGFEIYSLYMNWATGSDPDPISTWFFGTHSKIAKPLVVLFTLFALVLAWVYARRKNGLVGISNSTLVLFFLTLGILIADLVFDLRPR